MSASVIICTYTHDRWGDLVDSIESARNQTVEPAQIIVVVDHNPDLKRRIIDELNAAGNKPLTVVDNVEAQGLSGARNSGIAVAEGEILAFLDDDAVAAPDWLEQLERVYEDSSVFGAGGSIEPNWKDGRPKAFPFEFDWVVGCTYKGMPEVTSPVRNMLGANMSLRRSVFEAVGGFQSGIGRIGAIPFGCEETELCIRAAKQWPHGRIVFEPKARVRHTVPAQRGTWKYYKSRCYAEGVSKAAVARMSGSRQGLSSERSYVLKSLPKGIVSGVADAARGDASGLARSGRIIAGLSITTAGYITGMFSARNKVPKIADVTAFAPISTTGNHDK